MRKAGIRVDIPGFGDREIHTIVSDYTGTLSFDGKLIDGVYGRLVQLASVVDIRVLTADTFGTAFLQLGGLPLEVSKLEGPDHDRQKADYVCGHDPRHVAVFGNGNNDRLQLKAAKDAGGLAVAVDNGEGCAVDAMLNAHVFIAGIANALDLLRYPNRCKATLRF